MHFEDQKSVKNWISGKFLDRSLEAGLGSRGLKKCYSEKNSRSYKTPLLWLQDRDKPNSKYQVNTVHI